MLYFTDMNEEFYAN